MQRLILIGFVCYNIFQLISDYVILKGQLSIASYIKIVSIFAGSGLVLYIKGKPYEDISVNKPAVHWLMWASISIIPIVCRMLGLPTEVALDGFDLATLYLICGIMVAAAGMPFVISTSVVTTICWFYSIAVLSFYPKYIPCSPDKLVSWDEARLDVLKWALYGILGNIMFVLIGYKLELNEKHSYILTNRLKQESVDLQMQLERVKFFNSQDKKSNKQEAVLIDPEQIKIKELLGTGGFGEVKLAEYLSTQVAVKLLKKDMSEEVMKEFHDESAIMSSMRHPNIVLFMGVVVYPPMLVMELMPKGSVFKILHVDKTKLDWTLILKMAADAAKGMSFLHGHDPVIVHRDLKSLNLLVSRDWNVKVSDFGLSSLKNSLYQKKKPTQDASPGSGPPGPRPAEELGTLAWSAPEVFNNKIVTEKADVYSFGVIIYELLTKLVPYTGISNHAIIHLVTVGKRPTDVMPAPDAPHLTKLKPIMEACWQEDPDARPTFPQILEQLQELISANFNVPEGQSWEDMVIVPLSSQYRDALEIEGLSININELVLGPKIGKGSYATVYEGKYSGTHVAIKETMFELTTAEVLDEFIKECAVMKKLRHPNIVLFMGSCSSETKLYMVTELMVRGSIHQIYQNNPNDCKQKGHALKVLKMAADGCRGMQYLHSLQPPLIHRDIKSPNVLVDEHFTAKMADFGLSKFKDSTKTMTQCGSPLWVAPEVLRGERFGEPCDVYSFGIILWELFAWQEPYPELSSVVVMRGVASGKLRPNLLDNCPPKYSELMVKMWAQEPEERPLFKDCLKALEKLIKEFEKAKTDEGKPPSPTNS
jgi:serine/threonine protein kinase